MADWDVQKAREAYNIPYWGEGYFDADDAGHLVARPSRDPGVPGVDLHALAAEIKDAGLSLPVLVRFADILHDRIDTLCDAFAAARELEGYHGRYTAVYPIKVNQQRSVVEEILAHGGERVGLEAGSKPELMAAVAMLSRRGGTLVCNGYKDREYLRLALIARRLGLEVYIVVEKLTELERILAEAADLEIAPRLGVRVRLASIGAGKWQNTGGEKSKFGLSAMQCMAAVERLREAGKLEWLTMLHFHLGSQVANIRDIQRGLSEAARYYAELHRMGAPIEVVDVGGGLGVDYEGARTRAPCSMNYTVTEYANDVVHTLWQICADHELSHPDIITEAGRAMTAHHALLITNVTDIEHAPGDGELAAPPAGDPGVIQDLWEGLNALPGRSPTEAYHDAAHWLAEAHTMYVHGLIDMGQRARAEQLYFANCRKVLGLLDDRSRAHREVLDELHEKLADKVFCNFSVFQSMPDVWAIEQIFPVVPLHRLDEPPTRRAVIQDLTCDSDGRIDRYVEGAGAGATVPLHPARPGEPYLLGFFMLGAYQEILGDMHNLFGDTDSVNVVLDGGGGHRLVQPLRGDTVEALLKYVHFDTSQLLMAYRRRIGEARLSDAGGKAYLRELEAGLSGYTYLED